MFIKIYIYICKSIIRMYESLALGSFKKGWASPLKSSPKMRSCKNVAASPNPVGSGGFQLLWIPGFMSRRNFHVISNPSGQTKQVHQAGIFPQMLVVRICAIIALLHANTSIWICTLCTYIYIYINTCMHAYVHKADVFTYVPVPKNVISGKHGVKRLAFVGITPAFYHAA